MRVSAQIHAILGLGVYTPLEVLTGLYMLTGDGNECYNDNPDSGYIIFVYLLQVWLYTIYTAMMTAILYLSIGKVLIAKFTGPTSLV